MLDENPNMDSLSSNRKTVFHADKDEEKWCVRSKNDIVRTGLMSEIHAKMLASYLNDAANKIVTDCCVGGCYFCDS